MKISKEEMLVLQDVVGNSSLSLEFLHRKLLDEISEETLLSICRIGESLVSTSTAVLKTHKPLSFRGKQ